MFEQVQMLVFENHKRMITGQTCRATLQLMVAASERDVVFHQCRQACMRQCRHVCGLLVAGVVLRGLMS